jgi:hypothetical protein
MERRRKVVGSQRIGPIAEQSTFEGPANIAEPGVDEGNIAAVDATVEDDICTTGDSYPEVTVGGKLIAKVCVEKM